MEIFFQRLQTGNQKLRLRANADPVQDLVDEWVVVKPGVSD